MADYSELHFVARTDVGPDEGLQRVFGAFDGDAGGKAAAKTFRDYIAARHVGQFKVFFGQALPDDTPPET